MKKSTGSVSMDIVTKLDKEAEATIAKRFREFNPNIGFRGEEFGVTVAKELTWLVDPIDGTSHFVRGLPFCTTMVSLIENGEVIGAIIHHFVSGDTYWAIKNEGAYKNDEKISVSSKTLSQSLISFESNIDVNNNAKIDFELRKSAGNTISTVNSGFELSMVAEGKFYAKIVKDGFGFDWDYAPGSLLITEAGGIVRNLGSDKYDYINHDFIASNVKVYEELVAKYGNDLQQLN